VGLRNRGFACVSRWCQPGKRTSPRLASTRLRCVPIDTIKALRAATLAGAFALVCCGTASAEIVAPGVKSGMLALGSSGAPNVAYVRGTKLMVATRASKGKWRRAAAAAVPSGSEVMAFRVAGSGPVALVQSADDKRLFLVRKRSGGWQKIQIAGGLPGSVQLGWPGLALAGSGLPVVAYARWNRVTWNSQLLLVRIDARGRARSERVTAEGFPQSEVPPPAAPVFSKGRVHVIESYGYQTVVGTIEWYPDKKTWTGLFIDAGRGDFPIGPVLAAHNAAGTVYAAWTESIVGFDATPVTLAVRAAEAARSEFVLNRALTTALALPSSGPEIAANEWVGEGDFGLTGDHRVWAGAVVSRTTHVELDGWIAGLAAGGKSSRDVLLERPNGLAWFRARSGLTKHVTIHATPRGDGGVAVSGEVGGVNGGRVTVYRERLGSTRRAVGQATIRNGSFSLVDRSPAQPLLYRVVYTDPTSGIPYAALLRPKPDTNPFPGDDGDGGGDGEDDGG
jgi:hypothetical protein